MRHPNENDGATDADPRADPPRPPLLNDEPQRKHVVSPAIFPPPSGGANARRIQLIFVALSTRQSFSGWLNDEAPRNIPCIFVTLSTRQAEVLERRGVFEPHILRCRPASRSAVRLGGRTAHVRQGRYVPFIERLVEGPGGLEQFMHVPDIVDPPIANWLVELPA